VIKVSQRISGETVLEPLVDTLMRAAIEHAGAERALLILSRERQPRIAAEATTRGDIVIVQLRDEPAAPATLPESVLQYALRTREAVIIDAAASHAQFAADPYIHERRAQSILALPLITQAKLIGVLYLENHLAPGVFAPGRVVVLKLLASQAATALENARLYRDLAEREARIRRLVDAVIIGIIFWELDGQSIDANDAFLKMIGYDRHDISRGLLRWTDLTPAEWRNADEQRLADLRETGTAQPYEKEFLKKDGDRVPVLIGSAIVDGARDQGIAFVLELTDRKRAEEAARESERRYQRVQADFAHTARISMLGELTASIAHEVNQPLAAITARGEASLRWMARSPPADDEVLELTKRVVGEARRAS
jgi:PAS domain S-box-containing protein